jgi:hypothetical protein
MSLESFEAAGARTAQPLLRIALEELLAERVPYKARQYTNKVDWRPLGNAWTAHPFDAVQSFGANQFFDVLRKLDLVLQDGLGQARVGLAPVRSLAEEEFVSDDAEGPPVDGGEVAAFGEHFRSCARWQSRRLSLAHTLSEEDHTCRRKVSLHGAPM